ncbi:uncharacterized protein Dana_GF12830 [Drosophila ananassae]|uniref:Protein yippee-like n=1 Tax=Drosophila ananassae TaxID=7217 RepID=B3MC88_DROAN|nr:uncharacterized protein LOC6495676 [Drosophila ananassae]EDV36188.1 uncharacterized protein Dana_GF12830 [Drosophila ananassae]KAH8320496.1 hypothetical protein KR067_004313 [Drosophila pandora]
MSGYKVALACLKCGNIISYKSCKVGETHYDVLLTTTYNLHLEDKIRITNGEKFQNVFCSKCGMELGLFCLESDLNQQLKGVTLLQKALLVVYDSYEVPFELP